MTDDKPETRIQKKNREAILDGALDVFSAQGFKGATVDQIAEAAGLSKPNLLYYFASKEAIHRALIDATLDDWLAPLTAIDRDGDPVEEIVGYVIRKLEMSRDMPRESRLFANEVLQGAPHITDVIGGRLTELVDLQAALFQDWIDAGRLAPIEPHHLIFSIWATTQHYADFEVQVAGILGGTPESRFEEAQQFLGTFYRRALTPG
ncbi:MAG: TetR family transcriptional regulator C-terminal domain-containing protein [Paracoccaceae bacterium]|nr:TetR family transcriptional regulator C-terminal domain-containing protein [Paracoccaceae bacterium]